MSSRNGSLDVLRCVAIVLVINCHAAVTFVGEPWRSVLGLGGRGVDLFFVLSGWLLGQQLLTELAETSTIEVRRFWARRWLRTLPAYYAVLAFSYLWQIVQKDNYQLDLSYLFFGQTYLSEMPYFGVSWSLCVEEHFYLLIAPLLLLLRWRWGAIALAVLLVVPTVLRAVGWSGSTQTHLRWDQCGAGVLLAFFSVYVPQLWRRLCLVAMPLAVLGLAAAAFNFLCRAHRDWEIADLSTTAWTGIAASWVLLANASPFWRSGYHLAAARYLADRSYALYLLHVEAIVIVRKIEGIPFVLTLLLVWGLSLLLAEVLFRGVERPVMRAREWFSWSRGKAEPRSPLAPLAPIGQEVAQPRPRKMARPTALATGAA